MRFKRQAKDLKKYFTKKKKKIWLANKDIKRCSTSLVIKEMYIKTTKRYNHTPIRMAKKFLKTIPSAEENEEEVEVLYPAGGNVKWYNYVEESWAFSS